MQPPGSGLLAFEGFTLDLAGGMVRDGDGEIALRPKCFAVLRHLACNAGRLVSKDQLAEVVWGGAAVSDESLARCVSDIRTALRDHAARIIATVPRRGYRFSAEIEAAAQGAREPQLPVAPARLALLVLPVFHPGGAADHERFLERVIDSVSAELSRFHRAAFVLDAEAFDRERRPVLASVARRNAAPGALKRGSGRTTPSA